MKNVLFVLLFAVTLNLYADDGKLFAKLIADDFVEETNGYHVNEFIADTNNATVFVVQAPSYYTFDLIRMDGARIERKYSDVEFYMRWTKTEMDNFAAVYSVANYHVTVMYFPENARLFVYGTKK